ncbi:MAG TPA: glycosyltransferase family 2 protein [Puia sp.]|jgi:glycosyltransferase involved in cell wall biosynthesis|nr:glycosyltransferase family 2 protein [Puia sp.]
MQTPELTIIIPTFNAEKTLKASLDSVLGQDYQDFEVLIMDGVSLDNTLAIAREAARLDPRVRIVSAPDKGVYDAMNKGIQESRGKWLYFLGSDDCLSHPGILSSIFRQAAPNHFDLIYGNVVSPSYKGLYDGEFDLDKLLLRNISHQAIFYRRSIFDHAPAYNLRYKGYADWDLNIRLFTDNRTRISYIGGTIARFGPGGISSRHDVAFLQEVLFPESIRRLQQTGLHPLRSVLRYDWWWRLLRNAEFAPGVPGIPAPVARMFAWQQKMPRRLLKNGIFSKICMFASYLSHRLTGAL